MSETSLTSAIESLSGAINRAMETERKLGELRATLAVNFGPTSQSKERYGFCLPSEDMEALPSLLIVLEKLIEPFNKASESNPNLQSLKPLLADALRSMDRQDWMGRLWAIVNQAHATGFCEGLGRAKPVLERAAHFEQFYDDCTSEDRWADAETTRERLEREEREGEL